MAETEISVKSMTGSEPTTPESVWSSDESSVSSVGSLLDDLESKLDQLMAPDPAHNEIEESVQVEEEDVDEDPHGIMLPRLSKYLKNILRSSPQSEMIWSNLYKRGAHHFIIGREHR